MLPPPFCIEPLLDDICDLAHPSMMPGMINSCPLSHRIFSCLIPGNALRQQGILLLQAVNSAGRCKTDKKSLLGAVLNTRREKRLMCSSHEFPGELDDCKQLIEPGAAGKKAGGCISLGEGLEHRLTRSIGNRRKTVCTFIFGNRSL